MTLTGYAAGQLGSCCRGGNSPQSLERDEAWENALMGTGDGLGSDMARAAGTQNDDHVAMRRCAYPQLPTRGRAGRGVHVAPRAPGPVRCVVRSGPSLDPARESIPWLADRVRATADLIPTEATNQVTTT